MSLIERQRAIRSADAALREADLPPYADVVTALYRLHCAVEAMSKGWGKKPPGDAAQHALRYAIDAKELIACFQTNPVEYEKMLRQAEQEMQKLIELARKPPPKAGNGFFPIDDIDF